MDALPWVLVASCHERVRMAPVVVSGSAYANAVRFAGCRPLVVPGADGSDQDALLDLADGIVFTGSPSNVDPSHFGEPLLDPDQPLDPARDQWTLPLIRAALDRGVPFLAICRGCQEFNVALGGSLHQAVHRVPGMLDHRPVHEDSLEAKYGPAHEVVLTPKGLLECILGESRITVNSVHGQGIHRLAPGLRAEAHAPDGLIEAITVPDAGAFNLGVQWHPEWQATSNPVSRRIFEAFGNACRDRRARRTAVPVPPPMSGRKPNSHAPLWQGLALGIAAAAFFSVSFVLNRRMARNDGHWAWSASLRFLFMLPALLATIGIRGQWGRLMELWKKSPRGWIIWGSLGCGVFYTTLTAACALSPAWVVAATWPVAIVIGILTGPFLYQGHRAHIPRRALLFSSIIVAGVLLLQLGEVRAGVTGQVTAGLILVLISATAHPIGNRKSMMLLEHETQRPDAILRLTLLILGSLPFCLLLCGWGYLQSGLPANGQLSTVGIVAAAGLIATPLFYAATDRVNRDPAALAAVEATQAAEIVFTLLMEALLIDFRPPEVWGWLGLTLIVGGILLHAKPGPSRRNGSQPA